MNIKLTVKPHSVGGSHRTGTLQNITVEKINKILGFESNVKDDPYKVKNSWGFKVMADILGVEVTVATCGIWDYKGSHEYGTFSTYGPVGVFKKLFGKKYVRS